MDRIIPHWYSADELENCSDTSCYCKCWLNFMEVADKREVISSEL